MPKYLMLEKADWKNPMLAPLTEVFSKTVDGVLGVDQDNKIILWNDAAERLVGYKAEEILGRLCCEIFAWRDRTGRRGCSPACSLIMAAKREEPVQGRDMMIQTKDGRLIWVQVSVIVVPSQMPGSFTMVHLLRDVTRQVEMEMLLTKVQSLLSPERQPLDRRDSSLLENESPMNALTPREQEVLRLIASGESAKGIAEKLGISPATARNHTQKILEKLGIHTKLEAMALAFRYKHI